MKVLLVGNYEPDGQRSMLAFADSLEKGLPSRGVEIRRLSAPPRLLGGRSPEGGLGKWLGYLDKFVLFAPALRREARKADLVHLCDQGNGMLVPHLRGARLLLTCHDLIAVHAARGDTPGVHVGRLGRLFQKMNLEGVRQAEQVVCVSEATRRDAIALTNRSPERTHLVYNGLLERYPTQSDDEAATILERHGLARNARFLVQIGSDLPYKNRAGAVRIFAALKRLPGQEDLRLVFAGRPLSDETRATIERSGVADAVVLLQDVDLPTKTALYRRAWATFFPSLFEGFGLPIIEAQSLGSPIVTSDRAPMNEIAGDAGILIDPDREEEAAERIAQGLRERDDRITRGLENARRFTEDHMLDEYAALYRRILERA